MHREVKQFFCGCNFNDVALVDDADTIGDKANDRKVMSDEQIGRSALTLELFEQVQNLCTDGNVQCGDRFVCNNKLGIHDHCPCKTDSLTLSARELMRIAGQMLGEQTDFLNDILDFPHAIRLIFKEVEVIEAFGDNVVNGCALVLRCGGILENHLDVADNFAVQ